MEITLDYRRRRPDPCRLSAFFSGSETALTATSRARMHHLEKPGDLNAKSVNTLLTRQDRLIGALLIGNNLVNILGSALATSVFLTLFGQTGVAYATIAMTVMLVVFAEVLPKSWAISNPDRFALTVAPIIRRVVLFVGPLSSLVNAIVRRILKHLRRQCRRERADADRT
jgi:Mg2+/Co2+ transporter CorB